MLKHGRIPVNNKKWWMLLIYTFVKCLSEIWHNYIALITHKMLFLILAIIWILYFVLFLTMSFSVLFSCFLCVYFFPHFYKNPSVSHSISFNFQRFPFSFSFQYSFSTFTQLCTQSLALTVVYAIFCFRLFVFICVYFLSYFSKNSSASHSISLNF